MIPADLIRTCAALSQDVYENEDVFRLRWQGHGKVYWHSEFKTDTHVAVVDMDSKRFIVFRGTKSPKNALIDAEAVMSFRGTHLGFEAALISVSDWLHQFDIIGGFKIVITGHSLGGGLAVLSSRYFHRPDVITFGQPRAAVGWVMRELARGCPTYLRVVNYLDIVPRLPVWPFWHQSDLLQFDAKGKANFNPGWHKRARWFVRGVIHSMALLDREIMADLWQATAGHQGLKRLRKVWHQVLALKGLECHHVGHYLQLAERL